MNKINNNILFVGPIAPPYHGQSIAFTAVVNDINCRKSLVINTNSTSDSKLLKMLTSIKVAFQLLFYRFTGAVDVIYFTCSRSPLGSLKDLFLLFFFYNSKARIINHIHGADFESFIMGLPTFLQPLYKKLYKRVDCHIVLLDKMKEQLNFIDNSKMVVVPNFYQSNLEIDSISQTLNGRVQLVYLSNIIASKGILTLLDAIIAADYKDKLYLHIAGGFMGDDEMSSREIELEFYNRLEKLPNDMYTYYGVVQGDKKKRILVDSDVFILPSYYKSEAVPLSIIEAMVTGNYIIVSNHNYLPTLINRCMGGVVKAQSPLEIEEKLRWLLENKSEINKVKLYNSQYAKKTYSQSTYLNRIREILGKQ